MFETADEYFDYYRDYHAFWKLYGLDLPDAVLRKLYYGNALRVVPGLNRRHFRPSVRSERDASQATGCRRCLASGYMAANPAWVQFLLMR